MKKWILCLLILCCVLPFNVFADAKGGAVWDSGDYLTSAQEQALQGEIDAFYQKTGAKFLIYTTKQKDYDDEAVTRQMGFSEYDDLILFGITHDYDGYHYNIATYGDTYTRISDTEFNRILNDLRVVKIKQGEFASALSAAIACTQDTYGTNAQRWAVCVAISFSVALVIALIVFFSVRFQYVRKLRGESYPLEHYTKLALQQQQDIYLRKTVTRTKISSNSGGSRGGRSGGGGGGGRRGGR